jgi:hypothetical protein
MRCQYRAPIREVEGLWPTTDDLTWRKAFDYNLPMIDNRFANYLPFFISGQPQGIKQWVQQMP